MADDDEVAEPVLNANMISEASSAPTGTICAGVEAARSDLNDRS
jgi:hypothetical protein